MEEWVRMGAMEVFVQSVDQMNALLSPEAGPK
jgi:hypothetical protein